MTIIAFLIDTSASMNQRTVAGGRPTLLDMAKIAVEQFIKMRSKKPDSSGDRYMLLTYEEPPMNIKVGWKEGMMALVHELKNLRAVGMTTLGAALKNTFDLINLNRMQSGVDTFGQGRNPTYLEPAIVVVLTDGERISDVNGVKEELSFPSQPQIPGAELCKDIFRWDQRVFALVLRLAGTPPSDVKESSLVPSDRSAVDALCEATGGRSYCVTSHRVMLQCIESVVGKIQLGVVFHFEKSGPEMPDPTSSDGRKDESLPSPSDLVNAEFLLNAAGPGRPQTPPNTLALAGMGHKDWQHCKKMIFVNKDPKKGSSAAWWPVPENFWPDPNAQTLPPRTAQPHVKFSCVPCDLLNSDPVPFDRYEVEPSPLTLYILSRKMTQVVWQVFVTNSYKSETSHPFGYLRATSDLTRVYLYVLPYNYPIIVPLVQEAVRMTRAGIKPPKEWRISFENYLRNTPPYYIMPLKRALGTLKLVNLIPEHVDASGLSFSVCNYLKQVKTRAKSELDRVNEAVGKQQAVSQATTGTLRSTQSEVIRVTGSRFSQIAGTAGATSVEKFLTRDFLVHPTLKEKFMGLHRDVVDYKNVTVPAKASRREAALQKLRNAFDVSRQELLSQVARMRANFLQPTPNRTKLQQEDALHSLSVSQMGNFQDALNRNPPLREVVESTLQRQHMFGNPFKVNKKMVMMIDEADIDFGTPTSNGSAVMGGKEGNGGGGGGGRGVKRPGVLLQGGSAAKRKRGPIPRDFVYRPTCTGLSPPPSPIYSPPASPSPAVLIEEMDHESSPRIPNGEDMSALLEFPPSPCPSPMPSCDMPERPSTPNPYVDGGPQSPQPFATPPPFTPSSFFPPSEPSQTTAIEELPEVIDLEPPSVAEPPTTPHLVNGYGVPAEAKKVPTLPTPPSTPEDEGRPLLIDLEEPPSHVEPMDVEAGNEEEDLKFGEGEEDEEEPRLVITEEEPPRRFDAPIQEETSEESEAPTPSPPSYSPPPPPPTPPHSSYNGFGKKPEVLERHQFRESEEDWDVVLRDLKEQDFDFDVEPADRDLVKRHNLEVRKLLGSVIRNDRTDRIDRFVLEKLVEELHGSMETRINLIQETLKEAKGFRRSTLAKKLEKLLNYFMQIKRRIEEAQAQRRQQGATNGPVTVNHVDRSLGRTDVVRPARANFSSVNNGEVINIDDDDDDDVVVLEA